MSTLLLTTKLRHNSQEHACKGRRQNSLPLTTNLSQKFTEPAKRISYPVGDLCWRFTKLPWPSAYTLHFNPIPPTDGKYGLLWLVTYISQTGYQCFSACFCHPTAANFDVFPNFRQRQRRLLKSVSDVINQTSAAKLWWFTIVFSDPRCYVLSLISAILWGDNTPIDTTDKGMAR